MYPNVGVHIYIYIYISPILMCAWRMINHSFYETLNEIACAMSRCSFLFTEFEGDPIPTGTTY
jgi:hypothetical protein